MTRAEQMADATPASWVTLTVSDTGSGMSKEVASRAFEPFFTTKPVGEGTGLGLTTAYGIVKHCDGRIDLDTAEGRGTTVRLLFPAHAGQEIPPDKRTPLERPAPGTVIVLVEDEPAVAEVVRRMLQSVGYTVHVALAANDALRMLAGLGKVDLLITDVVMPEMNGHELARTVARDYPGLKVLYASGYAEDILSQRGVDERRLHFLAKPFSVHGLLEKVQDVLRS
jgi:CheY-like chemotaxis protein